MNAIVAMLMAALSAIDGGLADPSSARAYAALQVEYRGWDDRQFECLDDLWEHESRWDYQADNPTSSAYGIPQALTELHDLPDSWKADPAAQIGWGLEYIADRYGTPCTAWETWKSRATRLPDGTWHGGWY